MENLFGFGIRDKGNHAAMFGQPGYIIEIKGIRFAEHGIS
jgi:hypothetical protein